MEVVTTKAQLLQAVSLPQSVAQRKSTMPVLQNILLQAKNGQLLISASDLEVAAITNCRADVRISGSVAVNGRIFGELVRELPEGDVSIVVLEGDRIEVSAQRANMKLVGVNAAEFPALNGIDLKGDGRMRANEFVQMLTQTLYATSQDETRYSLGGVLMEQVGVKGEESLRCVATDGHRLSVVTRRTRGLRLPGPAIVPKKGLSDIRKSIEMEGERDIGVGLAENFFIIETSQAKVAIRIIDGEYPDYRVVIPQGTTINCLVSLEDFSKAIRRSLLMATDDEHIVVFHLATGSLRIESSSRSRGEIREEIELLEYEGEPFSIGFNPRYLADIAASFAGHSRLRIRLPDVMGPGVFSPEDDEASFAVLMPMRVDNA